jgi:hypothetical protein
MSLDRREYLRNFNREWIARRRRDWIEAHGPCGSRERLEVDHIDPALKKLEVRSIWSRRAEIRELELAKCQVLCRPCHEAKTTAEAYRPRVHGMVAMYKRGKCRCPLCVEANSRYNRNGRKGATLIFVRPSDLRRAEHA